MFRYYRGFLSTLSGLLVASACAGPAFKARNDNNDDSMGLPVRGSDSGSGDSADSGIVSGTGGAESYSSSDSGLRDIDASSMGGTMQIGESGHDAGQREESGGRPQVDDAGIPVASGGTVTVDLCADCKPGTFNEQPCCKLLPEAHCGVIFKGDGKSCIEWR